MREKDKKATNNDNEIKDLFCLNRKSPHRHAIVFVVHFYSNIILLEKKLMTQKVLSKLSSKITVFF